LSIYIFSTVPLFACLNALLAKGRPTHSVFGLIGQGLEQTAGKMASESEVMLPVAVSHKFRYNKELVNMAAVVQSWLY
jgi:hypothetical protein